ncbi:MAG: NADH-quinone oxidoreductase subunit N [Opitutaceae bacterium]
MNLEAVKLAAADNIWTAIFPELILACLALALLVLEIVLPKKQHALIPDIAAAGILGTLVGLFINWNSVTLGTWTFNGLLHHSVAGQVMRAFFLLAALLVCLLARISLAKQLMPRIEFYHILLVVTAAMMLLAQSNHFVLLFVALETLTIGLYILVSYYRTSALSLEAGLKFLIMGALSSGMLLFGIVLLYGIAGNPLLPAHSATSMEYGALGKFLAANPGNFVASLGIVLVLAGVAFKIGAFPFQIWVPDVYQGAPTPVTAFLAVASKGAGFAVLLGLCAPQGPFAAYASLTTPVLTLMAAATIIFGNIAALTQHNVKRLIGLSGVAHAGFLLLGVVALTRGSDMAQGAIYFYLFSYLMASFAVFGVMTHLAGGNDADQDLDHYTGLAKESPFLATVLAVGLGSLAGIPPLAGFMGKLFVFIAAYQSGARWLLAIAALGVVVSIYYYFGWIKAAFFETWTPSVDAGATPARPARTPISFIAGVALGTLALASIALGFYQGPLGQWLALR